MIRNSYAGAAVAILALGGSLPAKATVTDDASLTNPPGLYYGTGNQPENNSFTVDNESGIELGLSAITRYVGTIAPTPTNSNIYDVPTGATTKPGKTGPAWGFTFSINLDPSGGTPTLTLADISATLTLTDVVNGTTGSFSLFLIPDNTENGPSGVQACAMVACDPTTNYGVQNSESVSFFAGPGAAAQLFDDPNYNLDANDTYILTLSVSQNSDPISDTIIVNAGTGAPVPEPASLALLGSALLGFGAIRRRRRR